MARTGKNLSITQKNDASCISPKRGQCHRAKRNSNKRDRQALSRGLAKDLEQIHNNGITRVDLWWM